MAERQAKTEVYRVKSVNLGANTKATTFVRASSRRQAEQWVRERYNRHIVESCQPWGEPDRNVDVHEIGVSA